MIDFSTLENKHLACQIVPVDISKRKPVVAAVTLCPPCETCPHFDKGGRIADTARTVIRAGDPGCTTTDLNEHRGTQNARERLFAFECVMSKP
jgi:hypothetical protein